MSEITETDDEVDVTSIFEEPEGYFAPEKPHTFQTFTLDDGRNINVRLVGHNPLWGHHLWNGAKALSKYLQKPEQRERLVKDRKILELGAGAGLPGLVCSTTGAERVVLTDYPDADLIENLKWNAEHVDVGDGAVKDRLVAMGYLWGSDEHALLEEAGSHSDGLEGFDTLILADLLFNHSEHIKLIRSVRALLKREKNAKALVWFTPYRPWLFEKDMAFFDLVEQSNKEDHSNGRLEVVKVAEEVMENVLFKDDPGDELLRRTVFGYELQWAELPVEPT